MCQQLIYLGKERQGRQHPALLQISLQGLLPEAHQRFGQGVAGLWVIGPRLYLAEPPLIVFAGITADLSLSLSADRLLLGKPQRLDGINGRHGPGMASRHLLIPQCRQYLQLLLAQPRRNGIEQSLGAGPELMHRLHHSAIQRVELAAPVVTHRLQPELGFVGEQFGFKQGTRFKGILPQHTLTEAVNGEDGGLIHLPLGCQQQARRRGVIGQIEQ